MSDQQQQQAHKTGERSIHALLKALHQAAADPGPTPAPPGEFELDRTARPQAVPVPEAADR